jgi:hypothetical protein
MNQNSRYYQQFVQVYRDCVKLIASVTDREDFELLNASIDSTKYDSIISRFSETTPVSLSMDTFTDCKWEPFMDASLCNAWDELITVHNEVYEYTKLLALLSKLCNESVRTVVESKHSKVSEVSEVCSTPSSAPSIAPSSAPSIAPSIAPSRASNRKKGKKRGKKKGKKKKSGVKKQNKDVGSIDAVKNVFKGTSGEGVMSEMIDSIVNELQEPGGSNTSVSMSEDERKQMDMLSGMLNISPDQIQGVFGVAKKISSKFGDKLNSDSINSNELLDAAQNLLKNMM